MLQSQVKLQTSKLSWRINNQITAPEVRLIGEDGKLVGVVSRVEALNLAQEKNLTLIEIAPKAKPPVVKIADLGKFRYQEEKKLQKQKKGAKSSEIKEIRFSPFIADHDYQTRIERIREFLADNNKIRIVVVFKGRQMGSKQFGYELMQKVVNTLDSAVAIDMEPKFIGRHLQMVISPLKKTVKKEGANNNAETENQKGTDKTL